MYANEDKDGFLPDIEINANKFLPDRAQIYPEYTPDPSVFICTRDRDKKGTKADEEIVPDYAISHSNYLYLGHAATNEREGMTMLKAYREALEKGESINRDFTVAIGSGADGSDKIYRQQEDVEYFWDDRNIEKNQIEQKDPVSSSDIPIIMERRIKVHHPDGGGNVLFLDGHVEFIRMGEKFPYTEKFYTALMQLEADLPELLKNRTPEAND